MTLTIIKEDGEKEKLGTTTEHPFWVKSQGWINAQDLKANDLLTSANGKTIKVHSIKLEDTRQDTYNFEVADYHTYFVGDDGVWVHNNCVDDLMGHLGNMSREEAGTLISKWGKGTYKKVSDSMLDHARRKGFGDDVGKYLRKAANFNKTGAQSRILENGAKRWFRKSGEYIIERNGKIVSYGLN